MKKNKIALISAAALIAVTPLTVWTTQSNEVQAVGTSIRKTIMHTAIGYEDRKSVV